MNSDKAWDLALKKRKVRYHDWRQENWITFNGKVFIDEVGNEWKTWLDVIGLDEGEGWEEVFPEDIPFLVDKIAKLEQEVLLKKEELGKMNEMLEGCNRTILEREEELKCKKNEFTELLLLQRSTINALEIKNKENVSSLVLQLLRHNPGSTIHSAQRGRTLVWTEGQYIYHVEARVCWTPVWADFDAQDWCIKDLWQGCSATTAREKHATGMRVRYSHWEHNQWLEGGEPHQSHSQEVPTASKSKLDMVLWLLNSNCSDDWFWSEPLAE